MRLQGTVFICIKDFIKFWQNPIFHAEVLARSLSPAKHISHFLNETWATTSTQSFTCYGTDMAFTNHTAFRNQRWNEHGLILYKLNKIM